MCYLYSNFLIILKRFLEIPLINKHALKFYKSIVNIAWIISLPFGKLVNLLIPYMRVLRLLIAYIIQNTYQNKIFTYWLIS